MLSINSMFSTSALERAKSAQEKWLKAYSSGLRINSASDDPAGLAISSRMTSQIKSTEQAIKNTADGISITETASGALKEMTESLDKIRTLSVQAANGTNTPTDLQNIQTEINQLTQNISDLANNTTFNGQKLFDGNFTKQLQTGPNVGNVTNVNISAVSKNTLGIDTIDVINNVVMGVNVGADNAIIDVDNALDMVSSQQASIGAIQSGLEASSKAMGVSHENLSAARSRIQDLDYAFASSELAKSTVQSYASLKALKAYNMFKERSIIQLIDIKV